MLAEGVDINAASPQHGSGGQFGGHIAVLVGHTLPVDVGDHHPLHDLDAQAFHQFLGPGGKILRVSGKHTIAAFHQNDACLARIDLAKIALKSFVGDFGERPGQFHTGGAGSDNDKGKPCARFLLAVGALRPFEGIQYLVSNLGGFLYGLEAGGPLFPFVVTVVGSF